MRRSDSTLEYQDGLGGDLDLDLETLGFDLDLLNLEL